MAIDHLHNGIPVGVEIQQLVPSVSASLALFAVIDSNEEARIALCFFCIQLVLCP